VRLYGGGIDDDLSISKILGALADRDRDAQRAQSLDVVAVGRIRALHVIAEVAHDLGDPTHADAADADEVDRSDRERNAHLRGRIHPRAHAVCPWSFSAGWARRCAAWGWPRLFAAAARARSCSGWLRICARSFASFPASSSLWGITHAAPAFSSTA